MMKIRNQRKLIAPLLLIFGSLLANTVMALDVPTTAELLGNTKQNDQSIQIFTWLLGTFFTFPLSSAASAPGLIGKLFLTFNSAIFVVGMLWAGYGLIGGIAETAQTGEVLGKRLSAVWLPIRMVTGIAGIVPVFAGFSLAQVLIVTMTALGIGIANTMWTGAIDVMSRFAGMTPASVIANTTGGMDFKGMGDNLLTMHICRISQEQYERTSENEGVTIDANDRLIPSAVQLVDDGSGGQMAVLSIGTINKPKLCGRMTVQKTYIPGRSSSSLLGFRIGTVNYDAYAAVISSAYVSNFEGLNEKIKIIASDFSNAIEASRVSAGLQTVEYPNELIISAAEVYANNTNIKLKDVAEQVKTSQSGTEGAITLAAKTRMTDTGWIGAGAWYSTFAEANAALADAMKSASYRYESKNTGDQEKVAEEKSRSAEKSKQVNPQTSISDFLTGSSDFKVIGDWICKNVNLACNMTPLINGSTANLGLGQSIITSAITSAAVGTGGGEQTNVTSGINSNGLINPIIMFKNLGDGLLTIAGAIYALMVALDGSQVAMKSGINLGAIAPFLGPTGNAVASIPADVASAAINMMPYLSLMAPYLLIVGLMMSIYIPMIPFITWMGAVTQYSVVVCQGLVGAPIAALSHLEAEGEGMGRRTEAGYMFVLNVTFRPALMLFGFFLASTLTIVLGTFQVDMFIGAMQSAQGNSITGFLSILGYISLFFVMNFTLLQGLFNMIFLLPDQVLALIGSHGSMPDIGKETEGKMHNVFMNLGGGISRGTGTAASITRRPPPDSK